MGASNQTVLRFLDHSIGDIDEFETISRTVARISRCKEAVEAGNNLADILDDAKNIKSLEGIFGKEFDIGMQILTKVSLNDYKSSSFTINKEIVGHKKFDFMYRSFGGWKQFDTVLCFHYEDSHGAESFRIINPVKGVQWKSLEIIPAGTVVTVHLMAKSEKFDSSHEELALERYKSVFEAMQNVDIERESPEVDNVVFPDEMDNRRKAKKKVAPPVRKKKTKARRRPVSKPKFGGGFVGADAEPIKGLRFVISKQDTFVHAGNAQLIMSHLRDYDGVTKMYVLRGEKDMVRLDADSIWAKEIRNGEEVLYEFFGEEGPSEEFLAELIKKTNKYTQMDKCL